MTYENCGFRFFEIISFCFIYEFDWRIGNVRFESFPAFSRPRIPWRVFLPRNLYTDVQTPTSVFVGIGARCIYVGKRVKNGSPERDRRVLDEDFAREQRAVSDGKSMNNQ